jgi:hypothetical protein
MEIKHGLMSCDSHAQLGRDAFTGRMSKAQWGDRIPQVVEVEVKGQLVERWTMNGQVMGAGITGGVANCPALSPDHRTYPERWENRNIPSLDPMLKIPR